MSYTEKEDGSYTARGRTYKPFKLPTEEDIKKSFWIPGVAPMYYYSKTWETVFSGDIWGGVKSAGSMIVTGAIDFLSPKALFSGIKFLGGKVLTLGAKNSPEAAAWLTNIYNYASEVISAAKVSLKETFANMNQVILNFMNNAGGSRLAYEFAGDGGRVATSKSFKERFDDVISFITGKESQSGIKNVYDSIKKAPKYPEGFKLRQNGTKLNTIKNKDALDDLRKIESGEWKKVYKDGYDSKGNKNSIHYFQSKSGKVFDVKVKNYWSNK